MGYAGVFPIMTKITRFGNRVTKSMFPTIINLLDKPFLESLSGILLPYLLWRTQQGIRPSKAKTNRFGTLPLCLGTPEHRLRHRNVTVIRVAHSPGVHTVRSTINSLELAQAGRGTVVWLNNGKDAEIEHNVNVAGRLSTSFLENAFLVRCWKLSRSVPLN